MLVVVEQRVTQVDRTQPGVGGVLTKGECRHRPLQIQQVQDLVIQIWHPDGHFRVKEIEIESDGQEEQHVSNEPLRAWNCYPAIGLRRLRRKFTWRRKYSHDDQVPRPLSVVSRCRSCGEFNYATRRGAWNH